MKYGIFGGTFDPPHLGHIHIARAAIVGLDLDELIWVPSSQNPFKDLMQVTAPSRKRFEMVRLATENQEKMSASDLEITRGGASYTLETLQEMQMVLKGDFWVIIGADNLPTFLDWYQAEKILRTARVGVLARPGTDLEALLPKQSEFLLPKLDVIPVEPVDYSSTSIRKRIFNEEPVDDDLQPAVLEYIQQSGLYKKK